MDHDSKSNGTKGSKINVFTEALDRLPEAEKATQRMADGALVILTAGSKPTSRTLTNMIYHVLANPQIHSKLLHKLDTAIPDLSSEAAYSTLEALPYLVSSSLTWGGSGDFPSLHFH